MKLIEYWGGPFQGMFLISLKAQERTWRNAVSYFNSIRQDWKCCQVTKYSNQSIYQKWWVLFLYKFLT